MSKITPIVDIYETDPHVSFGYMDQQPYAYRSDIANDAANWNVDDILIDKDTGIGFLQPVYIAQANSTVDWITNVVSGGISTTWTEAKYIENNATIVYTPFNGTGVSWEAQTHDDGIPSQWWLDLWTGYPISGTGTNGTSTTSTTFGVAYVDYPYDGTNQYRIGIEYARSPYLAYSTNSGSTFRIVDQLEGSKSVGFGAWARLMFLIAADTVFCGVDENTWLKHKNPGISTTLGTGAIGLSGSAVAAAAGWHKMYFKPVGYGYSNDILRGFPVHTHGTLTTIGTLPSGCAIAGTVNDVDALTYKFSFQMTAGTTSNGYGTSTPVIKGVDVHYPPVTAGGPIVNQAKLPFVDSVAETIYFDPSTLNIYNQTILDFSNETQAYTFSSGVRACGIDLGYEELGINRRMTGFSGHIQEWHSTDGRKTFRMHCFDRSVQLKGPGGVQVAWMPYMDGWCIYKAMRYLANYGGITDDWLDFPICDGDINDPCGHYLLPYGDAFHPLVKFTGGMYVWDCMQVLQRYVGHLLFFDSLGRLKFYPYIPNQPGLYKKSFNIVGRADWFGNPALDEMFSISRTRDMRNVRNDCTIVGVDPATWLPIIAHDRDNDSIYNVQAPNYVGYRSSMVWADSMFATPQYAEQALNTLFNVGRLPDDAITISGWMQPDLFPLDVISAYDPHSTDGEKPYYITSITNTYQREQGKYGGNVIPSCQITAQWLTPWG